MDIKQYIEHTILKQDMVHNELLQVLEEARVNKFKGVCINPGLVKFAKNYLLGSGVKVVTVCGFPLGASKAEVKAFEAKQSVEDGADEVDMVINVSALKMQEYNTVRIDIEKVVEACGDIPVKVILETDLLTKEEIKKGCELCIEAGAKFVKTSTGFVKNGVGAKAEDVKLMHETVKDAGLEVKASGGVRSKEDALAMIEAGATRLGTSSGVKILQEFEGE